MYVFDAPFIMAAALVSPGVRRCLLGIRNGNPITMIKAELSQLVQERKREPNSMFAPELLQSFTSSEFPQGEGNLSNEEVKSLLLTLKVRGSDEDVLDSYTQFMRRAATVLSLNVSGNIIVPRPIEKHALLKPTSPYISKTHHMPYKPPSHDRMLQVRELTGETADIYVEYIRRNLPEGVSMSVEQADIGPVLEYIRNVFH